MAKHIREQDGQIRDMFTGTSMLLTVNEHNMQLERALEECKREYDILIDAILNLQKGILQPHIITPAQIVSQIKASQIDIPAELTLPVPLSATHQNLIVNILELEVFIRDKFLVYVIRLPLTNHVKYNVYHVLPLPIWIEDATNQFTFILPERKYLLMDTAKQYYVRLGVNEFKDCILIMARHKVCKQNGPLQLTHLHEECEVEMLQSLRAIPSSCPQRIAEINQTAWTRLDGNEWLYVAPRPDTFTILCPKQEPTDIVIEGTGRLGLHSNCKAYGTRVLIQAQVIVSFNNSEKDIIPPLSLDYDCCEFIGKEVKLKDLHLELPLKNVVNRLDDLRLASHKVDEVNRLILEQEWKVKHSTSYSHLSFLSCVGMVTTGIVMMVFCYCCCCKCCKRKCPSFFKWWKDNNPCTIIIVKPKIVNSVYSSRESLRSSAPRTNRIQGSMLEDAMDETELVTLKFCGRHMAPSGKR
jgi:hypothetical protein